MIQTCTGSPDALGHAKHDPQVLRIARLRESRHELLAAR